MRSKSLFAKLDRPVTSSDDVVTCFRDGTVTLRKNRRTSGFTESLKEIGYQGVRRGDLVIHTMDAFAGACGVSDSDGKCTPVYSVCAPRHGATNSHYYASCIREMARSQWISALSRGVRERSTDFRFAAFGDQLVPVPPSSEQAAIVRFLDHVDWRIRRYVSAKERLIELLEEQKRAIIHQAVTGQIDARTGQPYPAYKDSGVEWMGKVPEHWDVVALKWVLDRLVDCEHRTAPEVDDSEYRVVRTTAVRGGSLRWEGTYCTSKEAFQAWTRRTKPEPGDVIFTREAPVGEACVVPKDANVCLGQRTVLMRSRRGEYDPNLLVYMIYAGPPRDHVRLATQGTTVGHFNMEDIGALRVLKPPFAEQQRLVTEIHRRKQDLDVALSRAERQVELLREYRSRLIADVVTGKLDVREAAASLPRRHSLEGDLHRDAKATLAEDWEESDPAPALNHTHS